MIRRQDSLDYHGLGGPGKVELRARKPCLTPREMRLAYLPGAMHPAQEILRDPAAVFRYTTRGNLVAVVTNGTALPGLGVVGPAAAKPMQEGIAVIFKRLADIDVFDLELDTREPDAMVQAVRLLEPTFGGINLKDIEAPAGLEVYDRLRESMGIPVFHENLYATAIVAVAAVINALDLVEKRIDGVRVVLCGAGTVGIGCARLLSRLGVPARNLAVYDRLGLLHPDRDDLQRYQRPWCRDDAAATLAEGVRDADLLIGASAAGVFTHEMVRSMARFPVVLALASPEPEIGYEQARGVRNDVIVATSHATSPNAVLDLLSFPYVFRGALDVQARSITEDMMLAAARALAGLAREEVVEEVEKAYGGEPLAFGPEYLLPKPIDPRILVRESAAVAGQAAAEGVAGVPVERSTHEAALEARLGTGRETLRALMLRARRRAPRVVFSDGANETVLRACGILVDEGVARPLLVGEEGEIGRAIERLRLDLRGIPIVDPASSPRFSEYAEAYLALRGRRGVMRTTADLRLRDRVRFAAMMLHAGDADMMVSGIEAHYAETLRTVLELVGTAQGVRRVSGHYLLLLPKEVVCLADCAVNVEPTAEDLAEIACLAAGTARALGIEPRAALLSYSNFGSADHAATRKMRRAVELTRLREPALVADGEMQLAAARDPVLRRRQFPFSRLTGAANVLIFPDLQSGNLALQSLQYMGEVVPIGPLLMGTRLPAHVLQYGMSAEEVINLVTVAVVEACG
jgi:malate dehydrogenase (oxaloacetate-decarboxylating)(NADP+)